MALDSTGEPKLGQALLIDSKGDPMLRRSLLLLLLSFGAAQAQSEGEEAANLALNDTFLILFNGPVHLSSRLPMLMATQPAAAGMELKKFKQFSLGLNFKSDIYAQFQDVSYGATFLGLDTKTPDVVPMPALGLNARLAINKKMDAGLRLDFIPNFSQSLSGMDIEAGHFVLGGQLRYRLMKARGGRPELLVSAGFSKADGELSLAKGKKGAFQDTSTGIPVDGSYEYTAGPKLEWSLLQFQTEMRGVWKFRSVHPYLGFGFDFTNGEIKSSLEGKLLISVGAMGQEISKSDSDFQSTLVKEKPHSLALHPLMGLDFPMGKFHFTLQGDIHLPVAQEATKQQEEVEEFLNEDEGFYYVRYRNNSSGFRNPVYSVGMGLRYDFR